MQLAPIHLVVYKRLEHTKQAINALLTNSLAKDSVLIVSSDGAADGDEIDVENVRSYVRSVSGFKKIIINESKYNTLQERMRLPVKDSIDILEEYGRKITLEDDVVVAPHFLEYMNEGLNKYENDDNIAIISGFNPIKYAKINTGVFITEYPHLWGFGMWKRTGYKEAITDFDAYDNLIGDKILYSRYKKKHRNGLKLLEQCCREKTPYGDVMMGLMHFKKKQHSIMPYKTLCLNIGFDGTGWHCGNSNTYDNLILNTDKVVFNDQVSYDKHLDKKIYRTFEQSRLLEILVKIGHMMYHHTKKI
jgi:hypothetical protein